MKKRIRKRKPKLGQHFLASSKVVEKIIDAARLGREDVVLEIGPGKGILTEGLLKYAKRVVAVEKDRELCSFLSEKFKGSGNFELVCGDILDFEPHAYGLRRGKYKIIANIPYYITAKILRKFLSSKDYPCLMVLLVQKEVAERIMARDGKESILSLSVKAFGAPSYVCTVKAGSFSPPPKVDSAILLIDNISKEFFKDIDEDIFFNFVRKGFSRKRKFLKGNLGLSVDFLARCGIREKARAEDLDLSQWRCLALLAKKKNYALA